MVKVGIIGVGRIANNVHIPQLLQCNGAKITAICDIDPVALSQTGDRLGLDNKYRFTDYNDLIACGEVDAVEICTPNNLHVPMALAAAKAGKPFEVEKPLGVDENDVKPLMDYLKENPVPNMMCMSYRFRPATRFAKWILNQNLIGDIINIDVQYLQSGALIPGRRLEWRFDKVQAGSGALGDLGVHLLDLATFLAGDIKKLSAHTKTVVKERRKLDSEEVVPVSVDDYTSFIGEMEGDAFANFLITKCAIGNGNTIKFDVYATKGAISFNLNSADELALCVGEIDLKVGNLHTVKAPAEFNVTQEQSFIDLIGGKECEYLPTVQDGARLQNVLDAILKSAKTGSWVEL